MATGLFGGELGIRTLETSRSTAFRVLHLRPLGQLSICQSENCLQNFWKELTERTTKYSVFRTVKPRINTGFLTDKTDTNFKNFETYVMRTTVVKNSSGKIIEADININTYLYNFTVGASPGYFDIQSGMTHEMGHVVGMPHCFEPFSAAWTMYAHGATNDISKRSLETGDNYMFSCIYLNI